LLIHPSAYANDVLSSGKLFVGHGHTIFCLKIHLCMIIKDTTRSRFQSYPPQLNVSLMCVPSAFMNHVPWRACITRTVRQGLTKKLATTSEHHWRVSAAILPFLSDLEKWTTKWKINSCLTNAAIEFNLWLTRLAPRSQSHF